MNTNFRETWHGIHFLMCLITGAIWTPIWIWRACSNSQHNKRLMLSLAQQQLEEIKRGNDRRN